MTATFWNSMRRRMLLCFSQNVVALTLMLAAPHLTGTAFALPGDMAFGIRPSYNNVPDLANPGAFANHVVVYSLPATGSPYAGPANSFFDVYARVDGGGTQSASAYSSILILSGNGEVQFTPPPIVGDANNIDFSLNPDFPKETSFDLRFAVLDVAPPGQGRTVSYIALEQVALQNNPVSNGVGLLAMPIRIAAGTTGTFQLEMETDPTFAGFVKTITLGETEFLTHPERYPHLNGTIEVRAAVQGDFNGDLVVDVRDWTGFNAARGNLGAFQAQYPWLPALYAGDFTGDGLINSADVPAFTELAGVPEPSTWVMMLGTTVVIGVWGRRFRRLAA